MCVLFTHDHDRARINVQFGRRQKGSVEIEQTKDHDEVQETYRGKIWEL